MSAPAPLPKTGSIDLARVDCLTEPEHMPGFRSIRWRIVVRFSLLTAAILAVVYFYSLSQFRQYYLDQHRHHLGAEALLLSGHGQLRDGLAESRWQAGDSDLVGLVRAWSSQLDARVTIVLEDGSVLADSQADTSTMASQLEQPEILAALAEGTGYSVRTSRAFGTEMLYAAAAVFPQVDDAGNAESGKAPRGQWVFCVCRYRVLKLFPRLILCVGQCWS